MNSQLSNPSRPLRVFLAEDNRADVFLVEMALKEHQILFSLRLVEDGEEALHIIDQVGRDEPVPDIALLDLNLPRQEGDQIVRKLRQHSACRSIPIIVMTSSASDRDREMANAHDALFFSKPSDLAGFLDLGALVKSLCGAPTCNGG